MENKQYRTNNKEMNGLNGIIISGKVYEAVERGTCDCPDCALCERCGANGRYAPSCVAFGYDRHIFRFSQELTDKLNRRTPKTYEEDEGYIRRKHKKINEK